jgi:antitoxin HicB
MPWKPVSLFMSILVNRCHCQAKRSEITVSPTALECAKLGVYQAMTEQGIKKSELARRLGWHMPQVDRLFDLRHASKLEQIEAAALVLGRHIEVRVAA